MTIAYRSTGIFLGELPGHLLAAKMGSIVAVDGVDLDAVRMASAELAPVPGARRLLFSGLQPAGSAAQVVEALLHQLARAALQLWPVWLDDAVFPAAGRDTLGSLAVSAIARSAAAAHREVLAPWLEKAALLALNGALPRVPGTPAETELSHLTRLVCPAGLVLVTQVPNMEPQAPQTAAFVHGLEWIARHSPGAVAALFPQPPAAGSVLERIRHGALRVAPDEPPDAIDVQSSIDAIWLEPWRGAPHPMSEIEHRVWRLISADSELSPLFTCNETVETVRGSRPRVDLLWREGRLVVELDGYADHGRRSAFLRDRHRDFELALSGYTVLRLANEEVQQDCALAVQKIRDLVHHRRRMARQDR